MSQFESVNDYISFMKAHPNMTCPIKHTLDIIGGKWKLFIVLQLFGSEQLRFSQLSKNIPGITNTVLSGCLRDMEKDGIILRHQFNEIPPHVEYSLTEKGRTLSNVLLAIADATRVNVNWKVGLKTEKKTIQTFDISQKSGCRP